MCATRMLCWFRFRAYTCGAAASSALRPVPTDPNPAASSASRVAVMPAAPLSRLWLDAVEQPSQPVAFRAAAISAGTPNIGYPEGAVPSGAIGTSRWHSARAAPAIHGCNGADPRGWLRLHPPARAVAAVDRRCGPGAVPPRGTDRPRRDGTLRVPDVRGAGRDRGGPEGHR